MDSARQFEGGVALNGWHKCQAVSRWCWWIGGASRFNIIRSRDSWAARDKKKGVQEAMDLAALKQIACEKRAKVHEQKLVLARLEQECRYWR